MYHALLTRRYLTSKIMPLLASLAVVLCTAMVLITWSVMGGFLRMLTESGRALIGDVRIAWPNTGFAHYDDLIERLQADPLVHAASPIIETFGMLTLPDGRTEGVIIRGVDAASFARVTDYASTLWWRPLDRPIRNDRHGDDPRLDPDYRELLARVLEDGLRLREADPVTGELLPAVALGVEVSGLNRRTSAGYLQPMIAARATSNSAEELTNLFMPRNGQVTLRVIPLDSQGRPMDVVSRVLPVANEFESGLYDVDRQTVLVEFSTLQRMLRMHAAKRLADPEHFDPYAIDEQGHGQEGAVVESPARATAILVRHASDAEGAVALRDRCREIYEAFAAAHPGVVPEPYDIQIQTWEDANRQMILAVKKETGLVLVIFTFISMTAVFLVFAIFWAMISEKTKDIGILRALGAGRSGVAWLWLRYGLAIGVVGSLFGGLLALLVVTNINAIHQGLADLGRTFGTWFNQDWNWYVWDPSVYVFKEIPHEVEPWKAALVLCGGLISCLLGALVPALRAARMHPVKALRFE